VPDRSHEKWLFGQKTVCYMSPETKNCLTASRGPKCGCRTGVMKNGCPAKKTCAGHGRPKTALRAPEAENVVPDRSHKKWLFGLKILCYCYRETKNSLTGSRGRKRGYQTGVKKNGSSARKTCAIGHSKPKTALPAP
jgi:hypothetical protein